MELGEKLRLARQEAGLSQRQLCGEAITRNMLSQIEHGTARPSMTTLQYLASRLGKPVSWFLEEDTVTSPNQKIIADARRAYDSGDFQAAAEYLAAYREPDTIYDREQTLLKSLTLLGLAEKAITENRYPYALELLGSARKAVLASPYLSLELEHRRLLLLGKIPGQKTNEICALLPSLDGQLLLRAKGAIAEGDFEGAATLLEAVRDQQDPEWNLLRGELFFRTGDYSSAAGCFHAAEAAFPEQTVRYLELCYRELGDFRQAYFYARK